jgi:hypothetical protein
LVSAWWRKHNLKLLPEIDPWSSIPQPQPVAFSFLFYYCIVGVGSLVTAAANGPYQLRVVNEVMNEYGKINDRGKPSTGRNTKVL